MEIRLKIDGKFDLEKALSKIKFVKLDFSAIKLLQGDKDLLEKTFQEVKKELIYG